MIFVVLAAITILFVAAMATAMVGIVGTFLLIMALVVLFSLLVGGALLGGSGTTLLAAALLIGAGLMLARRRPRQREHIGQPVPESRPGAQRRRSVDRAPATTDPALADAWDALAGHADWARSRVAVARTSCDRFLQLADRNALNGEAADLAILIRKRIPEHVNETLGKLDLATSAEARALLDDAVQTVEKVGARAERLRDTLMTAETETLAVQRNHLSRHSDNEPFTLN